MQERELKTYQNVTKSLQSRRNQQRDLAYHPKNSNNFVKIAQGNRDDNLL